MAARAPGGGRAAFQIVDVQFTDSLTGGRLVVLHHVCTRHQLLDLIRSHLAASAAKAEGEMVSPTGRRGTITQLDPAALEPWYARLPYPVRHSPVTYRDMMLLDPIISKPTMLIRQGCVLVCLPPVWSIIIADDRCLFVVPGSDPKRESIRPVLQRISEWAYGRGTHMPTPLPLAPRVVLEPMPSSATISTTASERAATATGDELPRPGAASAASHTPKKAPLVVSVDDGSDSPIAAAGDAGAGFASHASVPPFGLAMLHVADAEAAAADAADASEARPAATAAAPSTLRLRRACCGTAAADAVTPGAANGGGGGGAAASAPPPGYVPPPLYPSMTPVSPSALYRGAGGETPNSSAALLGTIFVHAVARAIIAHSEALLDQRLAELKQQVREVAPKQNKGAEMAYQVRQERMEQAEQDLQEEVSRMESIVRAIEVATEAAAESARPSNIIIAAPDDFVDADFELAAPPPATAATVAGKPPATVPLQRAGSSDGGDGSARRLRKATLVRQVSQLLNTSKRGILLSSDSTGGGAAAAVVGAPNADAGQTAELLEEFSFYVENALSDARLLMKQVTSMRKDLKKRIAKIDHDVLRFNMIIQLVSACIGACTMMAGYYGMNLGNGECTPDAGCINSAFSDSGFTMFRLVIGITTAISFVVGALVWLRLRHRISA